MITKELLYQMHFVEDKLIKDIAIELGVNRRTIWRYMKKYGMESKHYIPDNTGRKYSQETINKMRKSKLGKKNPMFKSGRSLYNGYCIILREDGGYELEHVKVMENQLGRKLKKYGFNNKNNEIVHHINGDKLDNRLSNLKLMTHGEHSRFHNIKNIKKNPDRKYFGVNQNRVEVCYCR